MKAVTIGGVTLWDSEWVGAEERGHPQKWPSPHV